MRSLVLLLFALLLGGCSAYRAPSIDVREALFAERSDEAEVWQITLELANPNEEPLGLRELEYSFWVDGRRVFRTRRAAQATLGASADQRLELPAVIRFDRCPRAAEGSLAGRAWSIEGRLLYTTPGEIAEILLDTGVRKPRVSFRGQGRFPAATASAR